MNYKYEYMCDLSKKEEKSSPASSKTLPRERREGGMEGEKKEGEKEEERV